MDQIAQAPPMSPSPHPTYAGFWKRLAAVIIDEAILGVAIMIIFIPMFLMVGFTAFTRDEDRVAAADR